MKRLFPLVLALGIVMIAPSAKADPNQSSEYTLDPIIVTARGYAASQSDTPGSIGVVDERDIALAPKGSIVDALERIPGITRTGASPWGQDISIRGLSGGSIVILVNGKRIHTATDINARLGFINPADVERIEVLKGPVSALYGSGSTGGVVNIITRKATFTDEIEAHGRLSGSGSTNPGGGDAYGNFSVSGPNAWGFVSGSYRGYGDTFGGHGTNVPNSQYEDDQFRAMLGIKPWSPVTLTVEAMQSNGNNIGIPGGPATMPATARVTYPSSEFSLLSTDLTVDIDGEYFKSLEANFYYTENKRRVRVDQIPPGNLIASPMYPIELRPSADHETFGGKIQTLVEAGDHTIVTGADFWTWEISSSRRRDMRTRPPQSAGGSGFLTMYDSPVPNAKQVSIGVFAEDNWEINDTFTLNIGGRLDHLNTESDPLYSVSPAGGGNTRKTLLIDASDENDLGWHLHAGLTHKMTNAWSQSLLLSSSYRAADILERYKYINLGGGVISYGNPELKPEQSFYAEYGLSYDAQPFKAELRLFTNIITDYIAEEQINPTELKLENVDDARIYGAELDLRWDFHEYFGTYGNVTAMYARDEGANQPLPGVAPVTGRIGVDFNHPDGFWARLESDMIAPQRSTPKGIEDTKGVMLLGAAAGYTFHTKELKHDISVSVDNIFDTRYYNYLANQRGIEVWEPGISAMINYSIEF